MYKCGFPFSINKFRAALPGILEAKFMFETGAWTGDESRECSSEVYHFVGPCVFNITESDNGPAFHGKDHSVAARQQSHSLSQK
ncbi:hypothetical protein WG66_000860 [Moniliophthora roreri]|nr:hypothetical protein WG66_000860 [Moniliophthora roreri]